MNLCFTNVLFRGIQRTSSSGAYPSEFQSLLQSTLVDELGQLPFSWSNVYYAHHTKPNGLKFDSFNPSSWLLSDGPSLNDHDRWIFMCHRVNFENLLDVCLEVTSVYGEKSEE